MPESVCGFLPRLRPPAWLEGLPGDLGERIAEADRRLANTPYRVGLMALALMPWGSGRVAERVAELGAMVESPLWDDELVLWWRQLVYHDAPRNAGSQDWPSGAGAAPRG